MNVLFLTHSFPRFGGDAAGSFLLRLAKALRAEEVTVRIIAPAEPDLAVDGEVDGIHVARFHYAPRRYETLAYAGNMAQQVRASWGARFALVGFLGAEFRCAYREMGRHHADLVHAHWWFPNGLVGSWIASLSRTPLVTTMHGTDLRMVRTAAFSRPAFRHVMRASAAVTTVSRWLAAEADEIVAVPSPTVAPMPVATELFSPGGQRAPDRLLFVGRLNAQKGLAHLLDAVAAMRHAVSIDVVGDGEDRESLAGRAAALGIADRVRWHGALPQPRLAEFYRGATAVVVPSVGEGLGLVAVEAQLCETPVVAFASGGLTDVVQDGRTGVLVSPDERGGGVLGRALDELLDRPDRGAALGAAGRLHALSAFAPESVARRYAEIYRNAIASSPK